MVRYFAYLIAYTDYRVYCFEIGFIPIDSFSVGFFDSPVQANHHLYDQIFYLCDRTFLVFFDFLHSHYTL